MSSVSIPHSISQHLNHAEELANGLLNKNFYNPKPQPNSPVLIEPVLIPHYSTPYYYHRPCYSSFWSNCNVRPVEVNPNKGSKDNGALVMIGLVASAVLLYSFGVEWSTSSNANRDLSQLKKDRTYAELELNQSGADQLTRLQVEHLFNLEKEILQNFKSTSDRSLLVKAAALTGTAAWTYGIATGVATYVTGGAYLAVSGALAWALHSGLSYGDNTNEKLAYEVLDQINIIRNK